MIYAVKKSGFHPIPIFAHLLTVADVDELLRLNLAIKRELKLADSLLENTKLIDRLLDIRSALTASPFKPSPPVIHFTQC